MSTLAKNSHDLTSFGLSALMSGYVLGFVVLCAQYIHGSRATSRGPVEVAGRREQSAGTQ